MVALSLPMRYKSDSVQFLSDDTLQEVVTSTLPPIVLPQVGLFSFLLLQMRQDR